MVGALLDEQAIFKVACRITSPEVRADYLEQVCGSDQTLYSRVVALLQVYVEEASFLESPVQDLGITYDQPFAEQVGDTIGPYKIREQIGEGGMGTVYVAEQTEPVRRKVALKVIKPGMASKDVVTRFEAERQALAMMDHPSIARVLDGGATETGQPYFVMDLVRGLPITEYCDQLELTLRARLELFQKVCHAVQHAHQKGIIHRDLKPSNVIVSEIDGAAIPKVIDFGIAKAINQKLTAQTVYTQFSQLVGTPLYMSPEQAGLGEVDVDTRSDVYSLGVLLYELLTGNPPFDRETLEKAGFDELRRILQEDEPRRPSAQVSTLHAEALSTVSTQRSVDSRKLSDILAGELDWLVMRALEKDRNRRYESASALAEDIGRYLNDEPVVACPPSHLYRIRKFVRRNRTIVTSVSLVLILAIVGLTTSLVAISRERNEANAHFQIAREAIDRLMTKVAEESLLNQPRMQTLRRSLLNDALEFYQKLIAQRGDDSDLNKELALAYARVGKILEQQGELFKSVEPQREAVRRLRLLVVTDDDPKVRLELVRALDGLGYKLKKLALRPDYDDEESKDLLQEALAVVEPLYKRHPEDSEIGGVYCSLLSNYAYSHRDDLGRIRLEQAVEVAEALVRRSPDNSEYQLKLAKALEGTPILNGWDGSEENERLLRQAIAIYEQITAVEPESVKFRSHYAGCLHNFSNVLSRLAENDQVRQSQLRNESHQVRVKWVEISKRLWNDFPEKPKYGSSLGMAHMHLGHSLLEAGERDAAIAEYESAVEVLQQVIKQGPEYPGYRNMLGFRVLNNLIQAYRLNGDLEKELAARKIQIQITEAGGRDHGFHQTQWNNLVYFYGGMGMNALLLGLEEEGDAAFDAQDRILREHFQDEEYDRLWCLRSMGRCSSYIQRGRMEEAREIARELVDHFPLERIATELNGKHARQYQYLALFLATMPFDDLRRPHELASMLEASLQDPPKHRWWNALSLALLAARNDAGDYVGARQVLEQAGARAGNPEESHGLYSKFKFLGSQVLWNLGEKDSANRLFDEGLKFSDQFGNRGLGFLIQRETAVLLGRDPQASATQDAANPQSD